MSGLGGQPPGVSADAVRAELERRFGAEMQAAIGAQQQGRIQDAIAGFRRALAVAPDHPAALNFLGYAIHQSGDNAEAQKLMERSVELGGGNPMLLGNLGKLYQALNQAEKAADCYRKALVANPGDLGLRFNLAIVLEQSGAWEEAATAYRQVAEKTPQDSRALTNLGNLLRRLERIPEAEDCYRKSLAINPRDPFALSSYGQILGSRGQLAEARGFFQRCLEAVPTGPMRLQALLDLAAVDRQDGDYDAALEKLRAALDIDPDHAVALASLGQALVETGALEEAQPLLERAVAREPDQGSAHLYLGMLRSGPPDEAELDCLATLAADPATPPERVIDLQFALGNACDRAGQSDRAFEAFTTANALVRRHRLYDRAAAERESETLMAMLDPKRLAEARLDPSAPDGSTASILIVGMPRSATSLVEQILASHPQVHGSGESVDLVRLASEFAAARGLAIEQAFHDAAPDDLAAFGQSYLETLRGLAKAQGANESQSITNKLPANHRLAGLAALALPGARIVHCRRDPRDTCLSCYMSHFEQGAEFSFDLSDLGHAYRLYQRLMGHWQEALPPGRLYELDYETLVDDLEGETRRLLEHCGLSWDPACLEFHRTQRPVRTASAGQVRRPLFEGSIGRWRRYEQHLAPLIDSLGDTLPAD